MNQEEISGCSPNSSLYVDESDGSNITHDTNNSSFRNNLRKAKRTPGGKENNNSVRKTPKSANAEDRSKYSFVNYIKEDHNENLYNVQIYQPFANDQSRIIFVTVGSNRCSVYEYITSTGSVDLIDAYMDADSSEVFYTSAWTTDPHTNDPLISIAGVKGIIRTIVPFKSMYKKALNGHGGSINDLRYHPSKVSILLSSSQDYTLRLWNVNTNVCIAIIGGVEGHRDEVLSGDFNLSGTMLMSSSIDHSLKLWNINTPKITKAIEESETYTSKNKSFQTVLINFPEFSTRDIHTNYIDYVRWFGDLILSKSCENCVICWKPGLFDDKIGSITRSNKNMSILHTFHAKDCDIWYVRFGLDFGQKHLALGTQNGKVYLWDLDTEDPKHIKRLTLTHLKSKVPIRAVALSMNGQNIIAVNDEGCIFIWKKELH